MPFRALPKKRGGSVQILVRNQFPTAFGREFLEFSQREFSPSAADGAPGSPPHIRGLGQPFMPSCAPTSEFYRAIDVFLRQALSVSLAGELPHIGQGQMVFALSSPGALRTPCSKAVIPTLDIPRRGFPHMALCALPEKRTLSIDVVGRKQPAMPRACDFAEVLYLQFAISRTKGAPGSAHVQRTCPSNVMLGAAPL